MGWRREIKHLTVAYPHAIFYGEVPVCKCRPSMVHAAHAPEWRTYSHRAWITKNCPEHMSQWDRVVSSIKTHGILSPPTLSGREDGTYNIYNGGGRIAAALELGMETIPAVVNVNMLSEWCYIPGTYLISYTRALEEYFWLGIESVTRVSDYIISVRPTHINHFLQKLNR